MKSLLYSSILVIIYSHNLFAQVVPTPEWISFYSSNSLLNGDPVPIGAVINAYDPDGIWCGTTTVDTEGSYGFLQVYRDDNLTQNVDEGAEPGDTIYYKINGYHTQVIGSIIPIWTSFGETIEIDLEAKSNWQPMVNNIPNQSIPEGNLFSTINLDYYVIDPDHTVNQLIWTHSGNNELSVSIVNRVATITTPNANWNGSETITFRATDPGGLFDTDPVIFTVNAVNDPPIIMLPDSISFTQNSDYLFSLWEFIEDIESEDSLLNYTFSHSDNHLFYDYNNKNGDINFSTQPNFYGSVIFRVTISDDSGASAIDSMIVNIKEIISSLYHFNESNVPIDYSLQQNFPNPFNPSTTIIFSLPESNEVLLELYTILGQRVTTLLNEKRPAGIHRITLVTDHMRLSSGVYIYQLVAGDYIGRKKLILLK